MGAALLILFYLLTSVVLAAFGWPLRRRPSWMAFALLTLLPLAFAASGLLPGKTLAPTGTLTHLAPWTDPDFAAAVHAASSQDNPLLLDPLTQMEPWRRAGRQDILFNPAQNAGAALLGNAQSAIFSPPEALSRLLPQTRATTYVQLTRLLLAAWGMFLLLRLLALPELAALAGSTVLLGGGFLQLWRAYPMGAVAALTPWLLIAFVQLLRRPGPLSALGLALAGALGVTAGHPETLLQCMFFCVFALVPVLFRVPRARWRRVLSWGAAAALTSVLLAAPALLPFVETLAVSYGWQEREHGVHQQVEIRLPDALGRLTLALDPLTFGDPLDGDWTGPENLAETAGGAVALAALALVPAAFVRRRRTAYSRAGAWGWLLLALLGLLVACHFPLVSRPFGWIPLLAESLLKRLTLWWLLALAVLAAGGVAALLRRESRRRAALVVTLSAGGVAGLLLWVDATYASYHEPLWLGVQLLELLTVVTAAWLLASGQWRPRPAVQRPGAGPTVSWRASFGLALLLLALLLPRALTWSRWMPVTPAFAFYPETPSIQFVQGRLGENAAGYRVAGMTSALVPHSAAFYGFGEVRGYDPLSFADYVLFSEALGPRDFSWPRLSARRGPALDYLGVRYVFDHPTMYAYESGDVRQVWEGEDALVFENPRAFERLFVPARLRLFRDAEAGHEQALERAVTIQDFAHLAAVFDPDGTVPAGPERRRNGRARVDELRVEGRSVRARVHADEAALVVSSQPAIPGWQLWIDGVRTSPLRVNGAFLGAWVAAGEHQLELRYAPASFRWAVLLFVFGGLPCAGLLLVLGRRGSGSGVHSGGFGIRMGSR